MRNEYLLYILLVPAVLAFFLWLFLRRPKKKATPPAAGQTALRNLTSVSNRPNAVAAGKTPPPVSSPLQTKDVSPEVLVERVLDILKRDYGDFVALLRYVLSFAAPSELLQNTELQRKFSHVDLLLQLSMRSTSLPSSPLGRRENESPSILTSPDIRAAIVSIVRILQEMPEIQEKGGERLNTLVDGFLEKL